MYDAVWTKCMEIKENEKLWSVSETYYSIRSGQERRIKTIVTLTKYIQMVPTNMKQQVIQKIQSNVEIYIHHLELFRIGIVYWVLVAIIEK